MSLITLTSDLGYNNFALAEFKARFVSQFPQHSVLDLFHHQEIYDIESIAYQLLGALSTFPDHTVHIVYNKYAVQNNQVLITKINNQYILVPNNGLLSLIHFLDYNARVYILENSRAVMDTDGSEFNRRKDTISCRGDQSIRPDQALQYRSPFYGRKNDHASDSHGFSGECRFEYTKRRILSLLEQPRLSYRLYQLENLSIIPQLCHDL